MSRLAVLSVVAALAAGSVALGAEFAPSDVSGDAQWVVHLDVERLLDSQMGDWLMDQVAAAGGNEKLDAFSLLFGFDPREDLGSVTLYGTTLRPDAGVAIVRGEVDHEPLLVLLELNDGHEVFEYGEHDIHRWTQDPEVPGDDGVRFGAFRGDDVTVLARTRGEVEAALDVLDGRATTLADASASGLRTNWPGGTIMACAAAGLDTLTSGRPALLADVVAGAVAVGEVDGEVFMTAEMEGGSAEETDRMEDMLRGALALAQALRDRALEQGVAPSWAPLAVGATVARTDGAVQIRLALPVSQVIDILNSLDHGR